MNKSLLFFVITIIASASAVIYFSNKTPSYKSVETVLSYPTEESKAEHVEGWYQTRKADYYAIVMDFKDPKRREVVGKRAMEDIDHPNGEVRANALIALAKTGHPMARYAYHSVKEDEVVTFAKKGLGQRYPNLR